MKKQILLLILLLITITACGKQEVIHKAETEIKENIKEAIEDIKEENTKENEKEQKEKNAEGYVKVEDYIGMNYNIAKSKLESLGLSVVVEKTENTDDLFTEGMVANQSIEAGTEVQKGKSIILYIPDIHSNYPDFTDGTYTTSDVSSFCDKYGIVLSIEDDPEGEQGKICIRNRSFQRHRICSGCPPRCQDGTPVRREDHEQGP